MNVVDASVRFIMAVLLASLWQVPLFALAAWTVLRIAAAANATTRHSVLAAALFASLLLPAASAAFALHHAPMPAARDAAVPKGARSYRPVDAPPATRRSTLRAERRLVEHATIPERGRGAGVVAPLAFSRSNVSLPRLAALVISALWFGGSLFFLARLAISLSHLESLKRNALPLPIAYRDRLPRWSAARKGARDVRLCTSMEIDIPIAVGLLDAMILLPARFLADLPAEDVDAIVLHELAHLRRADDYINAAERLALALLFFNPGVHWIASRLDLEREVACDDWVLQKNDALPYATCLAKIAEGAMWPHRAMPAPGAFATRRGMSVRIERLLAKQRDIRVRTSFGAAAAAVGLIAVFGLVGALVSPSVAYDVPAAPSVPATPQAPVAPTAPPAPAVPTAPAAASAPTAPPAPSAPAASAAPRAPAPAAPAAPAVHAAARTASAPRSPAPPKTAPALRPQAKRLGAATEPAYIDSLASAGYSRLSIDDLMALKAVGVDAAYIRELERAGVKHPSVRELLRLRATRHGNGLGVDDLVALHASGEEMTALDQRTSAQMHLLAAQLRQLDVAKIRNLGAVERSLGERARREAAAAVAALPKFGTQSDVMANGDTGSTSARSVDQAGGLRMLGVTPEYLAGLVRAGYPHLSFADVASLKALGIDGDFIRRAQQHGFGHPSVHELLSLKAMGVL